MVHNEPDYQIPTDVMAIPSLIEHDGEWSIDLIEVNPWYNRMPVMGEDESPTGRRHLVARAVINNQTDHDDVARLVDAYISFEQSTLGEPVPEGEFTLIDDSGMPGGAVEQTIKAHSFKNQLRFRGENLFGAGHDNDTLYLTIVLDFAGETIILRRGGNVVVAM